MARLVHLHLQHGFADDTVTVSVNGVRAFEQHHISTSPLTALALATDVEAPDGDSTLEVAVPTRQLHGRVTLGDTPSGPEVLAANITDDHLVLTRHNAPISYE